MTALHVRLLVGLAALVAFVALPTGGLGEALIDVLVQASVAPSIVWGVRRHRPSRPLGWYVMAAAAVVYTASNVLGVLVPVLAGTPRAYPGLPEVLILIAYAGLLVGVSIILVGRSRAPGATVLLDTATITIGLSSLAWVTLIDPLLVSSGLPPRLVAVGLVFSLLDIASAAVIVHIAIMPGGRSPALLLLGGAVMSQVAAEAVYGAAVFGETFTYGHPAFAIYLVFYVLLGAAPLHPSMRELTEPGAEPSRRRNRARVIGLAAAALVPPATILGGARDGQIRALALITILTFAFVLVRLFRTHIDLEERTRVQQMKDEFVSVVSHELRTPLTVIEGALATLQRGVGGQLTAGSRQLVTLAEDNAGRLHRLVDDLLDLQRFDPEARRLSRRTVEVTAAVSTAVEDLASAAAAADVSIRHTGRATEVEADPERLHQVLTNLLANAVKFSPPGTCIEVDWDERDDDVLLRVRDRGRGVPSAMHERIFEPFQQVDASDARDRNGTGLGLAICRNLVEQHGGRIWVEGTPGGGATFCFTLPVADGPPGSAPAPTETEATSPAR